MLKRELLPTLPSLLSSPSEPFIHRDLSWLQFNERVLAEARNAANPILERVKFLAISASNLDEFFMIRLPSVSRSAQGSSAGTSRASKGNHLMKVRGSIMESVAKFGAKQSEALEILTHELTAFNVHVVKQTVPGHPSHEVGQKILLEQILNQLTPPEPFSLTKLGQLENLQTAVIFEQRPGSAVWIRLPKTLPGVFLTPEGDQTWVHFLDDLILTHLPPALGMSAQPALVRLTRDGDFQVELDGDTESIPDAVKRGIGSRNNGKPTRLQYLGNASDEFLKRAFVSLRLVPGQVIPAPDTLFLHQLWTLVHQLPGDAPGLRYPPLAASVPAGLADVTQIFTHLRAHDVLLHHPYDSFEGYIRWILTACDDPSVESIEQTIYRMEVLSPIVEALCRAAQTKRVRVVIELRARFDEMNNLKITETLRKAGVEVAFGFGKIKIHAKIALVTRKESTGLVRYTHLSTGNYNSATARVYTDMAILTANSEIGEDARTFFDAVWAGQIPTTFKHLVPAPIRLHRKLLALIVSETEAAKAGKPARIIAKVNALVDREVIEHLYRASQAGVKVDLIVRGACSLIPGIKGLSDRIRVISVIDRFLEHSRVYSFGASGVLYLSSADWMPRNFFSRLEVAFPVLDPSLKNEIESVILPGYLNDTARARELTPQGTWKRRSSAKKPLRAQWVFEERAKQRALEPLSETPRGQPQP